MTKSEDKAESAKKEPAETTETETFESEGAHFTLEKGERCRMKLIAKGHKSYISKAQKQAIKKIAKEVSIPGFRKGKAPAAIIEQKYPKAYEQTTKEELADLLFLEFQKLSNIHPLRHREAKILFDTVNFTPEEAELSFTFQAEPQIPEIDVASLDLGPIPLVEVNEEKLNRWIHSIQMYFAKWEQIEDRPLQEGDHVTVNIDDVDTNEPIPAFSNYRVCVDKDMPLWIKELIIGKNKGDSIEGESKPNPDATEEEKKEFKPKKVRIHILSIQTAELPEINDELAQRVGAESVEKMKERLTALVTKREEDARHDQLRDKLVEELTEKCQFELPALLLEKEANHRMEQLFRDPKFKEEWDGYDEAKKEAKKAEILKAAERSIILYYICQKVIVDHKITVSEEEMQFSSEELLDVMFASQDQLTFKFKTQEQKDTALYHLIHKKAQDYLVDQVIALKTSK